MNVFEVIVKQQQQQKHRIILPATLFRLVNDVLRNDSFDLARINHTVRNIPLGTLQRHNY